MLRPLAPDLWVAEQALRFGGVELGARMTVIRLPERGLFLHSPIGFDAQLRQDLEALGPPRFAVAPNRFHHLYAGAYMANYPQLRLFIAPGLETKRPDLSFSAVLSNTAPADWADQMDQVVVGGYPLFNEVVFFHRPSRTLLTSDLVFNIGADSPALTRWIFRLIGGYEGSGPTIVERLLIRDREAARNSLRRILAWDFDRLIMAHGHVVERNGRDALQHGYGWLLG